MVERGIDPRSWVYVADSAFVTQDNLRDIGDNYFVSRLPKTYEECVLAIEEACYANEWIEIGPVAELANEPGQREPANYKAFDTIVTLYGKDYRAIVIHSDAYDRRRQKSIDRQFEESRKKGSA